MSVENSVKMLDGSIIDVVIVGTVSGPQAFLGVRLDKFERTARNTPLRVRDMRKLAFLLIIKASELEERQSISAEVDPAVHRTVPVVDEQPEPISLTLSTIIMEAQKPLLPTDREVFQRIRAGIDAFLDGKAKDQK